MERIQKNIDRYNQIVQIYLFLSQEIDNCACEDKSFYQDVCLMFAKKIKNIQAELEEMGVVLH